MSLQYTDEKPARDGYYWYLEPTFTYGSIVRVFFNSTDDRLNNRLSVRDEGRVHRLDQYNGKWAGPIPEPEGE
jgi:hypothetical protein